MKARVRNYQSIEDTSIEIDGFTVLVGKSNSGKTALLRALSGSFYNDPVTGKVRIGESTTIVEVVTDTVGWKWEKGSGTNTYTTTVDGVEVEHSKVGRTAPDELVSKGFKEIRVDGSRIRPQIAFWHDPIFLLNDKGKVVTELISKATRLDVVNLAQRNCAKELRKIKSVRSVREADLHEATQVLGTMAPIDQIDTVVISDLHEEVSTLRGRVEKIEAYSERLSKLTEALSELSILETLPEIGDTDLSQDRNDIIRTEGYLTRMRTLEGQYSQISSFLKGLTVPEDPGLEDARGRHQRVSAWVRKAHKLGSEIQKVDAIISKVTVPDDPGLRPLRTKLLSVQGYQTRLSASLGRVDTLAKVLTKVDLEGITSPKSEMESLKGLAKLRSSLSGLQKKIHEFKASNQKVQAEHDTLSEQLNELMRGLETCPLCKTTLDKS